MLNKIAHKVERQVTARWSVEIGCIQCSILFLSLVGLQPVCEAQENIRGDLTALQERLSKAPEGYSKMSLSLYAAGHGIAVKQVPKEVTVAWQKPSFYFVHETQSGNNPAPACWYWLEEGQLQIYQHWEKCQPYDRAQVRGVRVANFRQLAGGQADAAYSLAKDKAIDFAFLGGTAADFLEILTESHPNQMEIERHGAGWQLKQKATDFKSRLVRESLLDNKDAAFVVFDIVADKQFLKAISIYPDLKKRPEYCESASIEALELSLNREKLKFPKQQQPIKRLDLKNKTEITSEIIDSIHPEAVPAQR